jgi:hypothetical protein
MHGSDLKKLCKDLKMTHKQLAKDMNLNATQLRLWFRSKWPDLQEWHIALLNAKCTVKGIDPKEYNL